MMTLMESIHYHKLWVLLFNYHILMYNDFYFSSLGFRYEFFASKEAKFESFCVISNIERSFYGDENQTVQKYIRKKYLQSFFK